MERSTIELILPESGAKFVIYDKFSSGQYREIQKAILKDKEMTQGMTESDIAIRGSDIFDMQEKALQVVIKQAFDKEGNPIVDIKGFVYDLPINDGNLLYDKVNEITNASQLSASKKKD